MEQVKPSGKTRFVLVQGVLVWGGGTALLSTLLDYYMSHGFSTPAEIIFRFAGFMAAGTLWGILMWNRHEERGGWKPTRTGNFVRLVFFTGLTLWLGCILWTMPRR
jgi:hypothetical protein